MLSRHDAAARSPLLAARGRLRWRLCDVSVMVITRKLSPGDPGTANDVRANGKRQFIIEETCHSEPSLPAEDRPSA
jgi:hypothetical protein